MNAFVFIAEKTRLPSLKACANATVRSVRVMEEREPARWLQRCRRVEFIQPSALLLGFLQDAEPEQQPKPAGRTQPSRGRHSNQSGAVGRTFKTQGKASLRQRGGWKLIQEARSPLVAG